MPEKVNPMIMKLRCRSGLQPEIQLGRRHGMAFFATCQMYLFRGFSPQ
jgi:hypothetical protein